MEDLPAPLPLYICKLLPDVKALDALTRASPVFSQVFHWHAVEILETLMDRTLHETVKQIIRAHIMLHARPSSPDKDALATLAALNVESANPLSRETPANAVTSSVRMYTELHRYAIEIIGAKLERLKTMDFERPADKNFRYQRGALPKEDPLGVPYQIGKLSAPSWIEEQRVLRALLRIRLFWEIAQLDTTSQGVEEGAVPVLEGRSSRLVFETLRESLVAITTIPNYERLEFDDVMDSLTDLHHDQGNPTLPHRPFPRGGNESAALLQTWTTPAPFPMASDTIEAWGQGPSSLYRPANASAFFHRAAQRWLFSPLQRADWTLLAPLGFGLWDLQRVAEQLKLLPFPRAIRPPLNGRCYQEGVDDRLLYSDALYTWKRLYSQQLKRRQML